MALQVQGLHRPADRVAVVSNAAHKKDLAWLNDLAVQEVGIVSPRNIGESVPWLQWVVDHYDALPDVVIFLHGDQQSWHHAARMDVGFLKTHISANITMLSDPSCVWAADLPSRLKRELPMLDAVYNAFWGLNFQQAFLDFHMARTYICCTESMVSKGAITRFGREVYQQLVTFINEHQTEPWGWVMERTWQNLFSAPRYRSDEQIVASLKAPSKPGLGLLERADSSTQLLAILAAAAACDAPML